MEDLKEMKILIGPRKKILGIINELKNCQIIPKQITNIPYLKSDQEQSVSTEQKTTPQFDINCPMIIFNNETSCDDRQHNSFNSVIATSIEDIDSLTKFNSQNVSTHINRDISSTSNRLNVYSDIPSTFSKFNERQNNVSQMIRDIPSTSRGINHDYDIPTPSSELNDHQNVMPDINRDIPSTSHGLSFYHNSAPQYSCVSRY